MSVRVTFVQSTGARRVLEVEPGKTALEAALRAGVPEVESTCGGACTCACCHVHVEPAWFERLEGASRFESDMLSLLDERRPQSRLACQIRLDDSLDGLTLHTLPEEAEAAA